MARKTGKKEVKDELVQYTFERETLFDISHKELVSAEIELFNGEKMYMDDLYIEPKLQWAGKTEGTSYTIPNRKR